MPARLTMLCLSLITLTATPSFVNGAQSIEFKAVALSSDAVTGKSPVRLESEQTLLNDRELLFRIAFSEWPAECTAKYAVVRLRQKVGNREVTVNSASGRIVKDAIGRVSMEAKMNPVTIEGQFSVTLQIGPAIVGQGEIATQ